MTDEEAIARASELLTPYLGALSFAQAEGLNRTLALALGVAWMEGRVAGIDEVTSKGVK